MTHTVFSIIIFNELFYKTQAALNDWVSIFKVLCIVKKNQDNPKLDTQNIQNDVGTYKDVFGFYKSIKPHEHRTYQSQT